MSLPFQQKCDLYDINVIEQAPNYNYKEDDKKWCCRNAKNLYSKREGKWIMVRFTASLTEPEHQLKTRNCKST